MMTLAVTLSAIHATAFIIFAWDAATTCHTRMVIEAKGSRPELTVVH